MSGGFGGENGGFSESAASLTFHDPDDDNEVGIDTQADDFRFNFTLPSQDFQNYGASSLSFDDDRLEDNIKMVKFGSSVTRIYRATFIITISVFPIAVFTSVMSGKL